MPRNIKNKSLPEGPLEPDECVLGPVGRLERKARVLYSTVMVVVQTALRRDVRERVADIMSSKRGMARRLEVIKAERAIATIQELYSIRNLGRLGLRVATCVCGPEDGHNAPKRGLW